jgi:heme/copper-type cytochrome/quinol oxidase subunit 1
MTVEGARRGRGTAAAAAVGCLLIVGGGLLTWHGSRPQSSGWFAYAPLQEGASAPVASPAELTIGLVLLGLGVLLVGAVAGAMLARRRA